MARQCRTPPASKAGRWGQGLTPVRTVLRPPADLKVRRAARRHLRQVRSAACRRVPRRDHSRPRVATAGPQRRAHASQGHGKGTARVAADAPWGGYPPAGAVSFFMGVIINHLYFETTIYVCITFSTSAKKRLRI